MVRFAEVFPDPRIVNALSTQLGWTHFRHILPLDEPLQRIMTRHPVARGFGLIAPAARLRWRALILSTFPGLLIAFAVAWRIVRR